MSPQLLAMQPNELSESPLGTCPAPWTASLMPQSVNHHYICQARFKVSPKTGTFAKLGQTPSWRAFVSRSGGGVAWLTGKGKRRYQESFFNPEGSPGRRLSGYRGGVAARGIAQGGRTAIASASRGCDALVDWMPTRATWLGPFLAPVDAKAQLSKRRAPRRFLTQRPQTAASTAAPAAPSRSSRHAWPSRE